jgi:hypothetical protein
MKGWTSLLNRSILLLAMVLFVEANNRASGYGIMWLLGMVMDTKIICAFEQIQLQGRQRALRRHNRYAAQGDLKVHIYIMR